MLKLSSFPSTFFFIICKANKKFRRGISGLYNTTLVPITSKEKIAKLNLHLGDENYYLNRAMEKI